MDAILIFVLLVIVGIAMLIVGLRGLLTRKVTIYSAKLIAGIIAICFLPQFINSVKLISQNFVLGLTMSAVYPALLFVIWRVCKGYIFFGVSDVTMSEAIKSVFTEMNLKYTERLASLQIEDGSEVQIAVQAWVGTAQVKPKNQKANELMSKAIPLFSDYFSKSALNIKSFCYWIYTLSGCFLISLLFILLFVA